MASQSSRSSLVGPPTTVYEEEEGEMEFKMPANRDENLPPPGRRAGNDRKVHLLSPPVERAIKSFNEELDAVAGSLDELMAQLKYGGRPTLPPASYP